MQPMNAKLESLNRLIRRDFIEVIIWKFLMKKFENLASDLRA